MGMNFISSCILCGTYQLKDGFHIRFPLSIMIFKIGMAKRLKCKILFHFPNFGLIWMKIQDS